MAIRRIIVELHHQQIQRQQQHHRHHHFRRMSHRIRHGHLLVHLDQHQVHFRKS